MRNVVYIIYNPLNELSKVGYTTQDFYRRYNQLINQSGIKLKVRKIYEPKSENAISLEKRIHFKFKNKRVIGEWFNLSNKDICDLEKDFNNIMNIHIS